MIGNLSRTVFQKTVPKLSKPSLEAGMDSLAAFLSWQTVFLEHITGCEQCFQATADCDLCVEGRLLLGEVIEARRLVDQQEERAWA